MLPPPENTSLEFVETIGRLYFQQKNHSDLAKKKIIFFKEFLRTSFYIGTSQLNQESAKKVSMRSGIPEDKIKSLPRKETRHGTAAERMGFLKQKGLSGRLQ